jgi:CheY-like chemotaxis protein
MASVFVVEDEALIRMMVADMVVELGHQVAAEAGDLASALEHAHRGAFDLALLDVRLGNHSVQPVAEALARRNVPFVFASGYGADGVPDEFAKHPRLQKPFRIEQLERCIAELLGS